MSTLTIQIRVYCNCGEDLPYLGVEYEEGAGIITVPACPVCMKAAREEGYDMGYVNGCDDTMDDFERRKET